MAFDMYLESEHICIEHYEEDIFMLVADNEKFPKLIELWNNFYDGPRINPYEANELVHELISLRSIVTEKRVMLIIDKLLPFFSKSFTLKLPIKCESD